MPSIRCLVALLFILLNASWFLHAEEQTPAQLLAAYRRAEGYHAEVANGVDTLQITPHWLADGSRFWYRLDRRDGGREFILVEPDRALRQPAFHHERLADKLSTILAYPVDASHLPFDDIELLDHSRAIRFRIGRDTWQAHLPDCTLSLVIPAPGWERIAAPRRLDTEVAASSPADRTTSPVLVTGATMMPTPRRICTRSPRRRSSQAAGQTVLLVPMASGSLTLPITTSMCVLDLRAPLVL